MFVNPNEVVGLMRQRIVQLAVDKVRLERRLAEYELAASAMIASMQTTICALELDLAELRAEQELAVTPIDIWRLDHAE